jgi:hypothetical protein
LRYFNFPLLHFLLFFSARPFSSIFLPSSHVPFLLFGVLPFPAPDSFSVHLVLERHLFASRVGNVSLGDCAVVAVRVSFPSSFLASAWLGPLSFFFSTLPGGMR